MFYFDRTARIIGIRKQSNPQVSVDEVNGNSTDILRFTAHTILKFGKLKWGTYVGDKGLLKDF
jgi:hypothetical protein